MDGMMLLLVLEDDISTHGYNTVLDELKYDTTTKQGKRKMVEVRVASYISRVVQTQLTRPHFQVL